MLESSQHDGVRLPELNSPVTKAYGSGKSRTHPSLGHSGMCWVASSHFVYIVVVWNCLTLSVIPSGPRFCCSTATSCGLGSVWSITVRTSLQAEASHVPSWFVSYFDWAISAFALVGSPELPGEA